MLLTGNLTGQQTTVPPVVPVFTFPPISEIALTLIFVAITLFVALVVIKIIQRTVKKSLERKKVNPDMKYLAVKAVSWIVWFFVILWILIQFGQQELVVAMFASGGIVGIAVALAAKDSLAGIFGGLFLLQVKDFSIGDKIKIGSIEGRIKEVGLRKTRIRLPNGTIEIVPNNKIDNDGWTLMSSDKKPEKLELNAEEKTNKVIIKKK